MDPRNERLATLLLDYSIQVKPGETLYLEVKGKETLELAQVILRLATERGVTPFWFYNDETLLRQFMMSASEAQMQRMAELHLELMTRSDCYIGLRGSENPFDLADIPPEQTTRFKKLFSEPVHMQRRLKHTRWVVLRYPNPAMAQLAGQPTDTFADFYYRVCLLDYKRMSQAQDQLHALMSTTDQVRIVAPGTDLTFSIKGINCVKCDGRLNIPDGEVYTAPVRDSVNGVIRYNTPSLLEGTVFEDIEFVFRDGKIVQATAGANTVKLNHILDTDEGARYVGEFAIGCNPLILQPMKDTLFDEKIAGSLHFTPGNSYDDAPNGNHSAVHWDLVLIQRADYGGGEIWFDGKLIRKDGVFTDPELEKVFSAEYLQG
ncbi:MAG: aminopeptidase [Candidatus Komeilibacteria bacterium]|nr:aminopeptidase [Candidatus Komeilibacteria bacterium]